MREDRTFDELGEIHLLKPRGLIVVVLPVVAPVSADEEANFPFCSATTDVCRDDTVAVKASISLAKLAVVRSVMAEVTEAVADGGDAGGLGADAGVEVGCGGSAEEEEERLEPDTKLSRSSVPKTAGPRLRSS